MDISACKIQSSGVGVKRGSPAPLPKKKIASGLDKVIVQIILDHRNLRQ
jgi:hypothetical protein